jgi:hypothetical protein
MLLKPFRTKQLGPDWLFLTLAIVEPTSPPAL